MGLFAYHVETYRDARRHDLGDFRTLDRARKAARHALDSPRTTLAVVRDADGVLVFATDGAKEWTEGEEVMLLT